jgi:hypothetical protein
LKPGDKLVFTGCGLLDTERSSRWCGNAFEQVGMISFACHTLLLHGIDANEIYAPYFSCTDCGTELGWGQVILKAYIVDEGKGQKVFKAGTLAKAIAGGKAKPVAKAKAATKAVKTARQAKAVKAAKSASPAKKAKAKK